VLYLGADDLEVFGRLDGDVDAYDTGRRLSSVADRLAVDHGGRSHLARAAVDGEQRRHAAGVAADTQRREPATPHNVVS